jgi:nucleotide-binding universal stress UspA family protein
MNFPSFFVVHWMSDEAKNIIWGLMAMFRKILFPTDFSLYANTVFDCLPSLKTVGVEEVVLTNIMRLGDAQFSSTYNQEALQFMRWGVEEQLNVQRMALEGHGYRVIPRIREGVPGIEIAEISREENVDLIVLGAQGTSLSTELILGSTAFEIIRKAPVPVLLLQAEVIRSLGHLKCRWNCTNMFRRIVHPTDFSPCADKALDMMVNLVNDQTEEAILLHVQDERMMKHRLPEQIEEFDKTDEERLSERAQKFQGAARRVQTRIRRGIPFQETLKLADEVKAGVIILGSQGRSAIKELLTGSTLENVARLSRVPVLIVRS